MKQRTTKQLLRILYDEVKYKPFIKHGLCYEIDILLEYHYINVEESVRLERYIWSNRPFKGRFFVKELAKTSWYFPSGEVKQRKEWLEYLIKN